MEDVTPVTIRSGILCVEISTLGAELRRFTDSSRRELLWNGDQATWRGRAPILFPVIGLLVNGCYRLDGVIYEMPKHGFARYSVFEIGARTDDMVMMRLTASDKTRQIYPFEFQLDIEFALAANVLRIAATISNWSAVPMPASFGFHPAFRWPLPYGVKREDHRIRFAYPEPEPIRRINARGFLKAVAEPTPVRGDELRVGDALFLDDAIIFDRLTSRCLDYGGDAGPQIRVRFDDFPILGVWTKPGAGFLAIEPWQGLSDPEGFDGDLREKPGIVEIAPGSARELAMSISLVPEQ